VKNITSICIVWVLAVAISSTVIAQRTSSVVQRVTFGVHRSSLSVLRNVSLVQCAVHSSDSSQASTFQNVVSNYPMKVTVNALSIPEVNDRAMTAVQRSPRLSAQKSVGSGSDPTTSDTQFNPSSSYHGTALVVTLTE
jgi:hypothetical protein